MRHSGAEAMNALEGMIAALWDSGNQTTFIHRVRVEEADELRRMFWSGREAVCTSSLIGDTLQRGRTIRRH